MCPDGAWFFLRVHLTRDASGQPLPDKSQFNAYARVWVENDRIVLGSSTGMKEEAPIFCSFSCFLFFFAGKEEGARTPGGEGPILPTWRYR
jgi:hypothetical protein